MFGSRRIKALEERIAKLESENEERFKALEHEVTRMLIAERDQRTEQVPAVSMPDQEGEVWPRRR